jgi:hypothetical protein
MRNRQEKKKKRKKERVRQRKREEKKKEREGERVRESKRKKTIEKERIERERELFQKLLYFPKFQDQTFEIKYLVPKFEILTKYFVFPFPFSGTGKLRSLVGPRRYI